MALNELLSQRKTLVGQVTAYEALVTGTGAHVLAIIEGVAKPIGVNPCWSVPITSSRCSASA